MSDGTTYQQTLFTRGYEVTRNARRTTNNGSGDGLRRERVTVGLPAALKLKRRGRSRPLGSRALGWRSSSKKACEQASSGEKREAGVYSSSREQRLIASGGVRGLNTWGEGGGGV